MRLEAARAIDNAELRDSFLALSLQYERLAVVLEKSAAGQEAAPIPNPKSSSTA